MIFKKRAKTQDKLIDDIRKLNQQLERAHASFQQETDSDLISSYIYEINALKARYSYLFKLAKRMGVRSCTLSVGVYQGECEE